jgi:hypothetical protein
VIPLHTGEDSQPATLVPGPWRLVLRTPLVAWTVMGRAGLAASSARVEGRRAYGPEERGLDGPHLLPGPAFLGVGLGKPHSWVGSRLL